METFLDFFKDIDYGNFPILKVVIIVGLFILILLLRKLIFSIAIKRLESIADKSETKLDDELLKIIRPAISVLIYISSLWLIPIIFSVELGEQARRSVVEVITLISLVGIVFILYRLSSILGYFISNLLVKTISKLTQETEEQHSGDLISILRPSVRLLVFLVGLWMLQLFLGGRLSNNLSNTFSDGLGLLSIVIVATVMYRTATVLGEITANLLLATTEEAGLSELLRPLLPKVFQALAVILLVIKAATVFFGGATGPLVGLLGGAGLTLGLLFKDLLYDWLCTIIIYTDRLYQKGDWIVVSGLDAMVQVVDIGFRSTSLLSSTRASIQKIPNSKMISGNFQNWSQDAGEEEVWGIPITLKIDNISSTQAARVCEGLREVHQSLEGVKDKVLIRFKGLEQNSRVFEFRLYTVLSSFFRIEKEAHIAILAMLEKEGIKTLYVELRTDPDSYNQMLKAARN